MRIRNLKFNKHLMTGPKGNSEFCFPETLNVPRGEAEGNIEVEGKQNSLFPEGPVIKDGAYYCYCAYVLRISRYSDFLSPMLINTGMFLRGLKISGESRSQ